MPKIERSYVAGKYGQIHLRTAGPVQSANPPLICMHMFPQSGRSFTEFLNVASADRLVVAPDFAGYGESDPPPHPITASEYAADIWHALDNADLFGGDEVIDVFGIHAGAKLAVEAASQRPAAVRKLVLSSAALLDSEEVSKWRKALSHIPLDREGTRFRNLWHMLVEDTDDQTGLERRANSLAEMLRGGERYSWGSQAVFDYNSTFGERLAMLEHPVLVLNPNDGLHEQTLRTVKLFQNAEAVNFTDWGLNYVEVHAAEVSSIVTAFLDRASASARNAAATMSN